MNEHIIYRLDDNISFRKCSLFNGRSLSRGNCTNFEEQSENWKSYYFCKQNGIHLHCTTHPAIELEQISPQYFDGLRITLQCPRCKKPINVSSISEVVTRCLRMMNIEEFKDAKLIRLDDWYVPEVKERKKTSSGYWINTQVKTDKDGDTVIVVYVGHEGSNNKSQFFIKPEKLQLSSDHKDMDPAKVLSKIEVTFKDRTLRQDYED